LCKGLDIGKKFNITLIYLPAYSPDINPIEKKCSQIKYWQGEWRNKYRNQKELLGMLLRIKESSRLYYLTILH
jgi:transposase